MISHLREDVQTVFEKDPAAKSLREVLTCYPGLHAIWMHRIAHFFWERGFLWTARLVSHISRFFTEIEIHPGAEIGRRFFIDHGSGVVIGETAEIGDDVLLYQGTTLGGTSLEQEKRHPTLEDNVVVGANATLLGPITIGEHARVGAGSVVLDEVPPHSTAVGVPARPSGEQGAEDMMELQHGDLPDPVFNDINSLFEFYRELDDKLAELDEKLERLDARKDKKRQ
ncbi:serine O-acetyltransferase [Halobacteriaceae archaeon GCM10025711]